MQIYEILEWGYWLAMGIVVVLACILAGGTILIVNLIRKKNSGDGT